MGAAVICMALALAVLPRASSSLIRIAHESGRPQQHEAPADDAHAVATTFDMLAACLRGGLPVGAAARAASTVAPERSGHALRVTADLLSLGADPEAAWAPVAEMSDVEALARMARRSARSGASLVDAVTELAETERARSEDAAAAAAERAGVLISGPLGLCFLPAFVCLGIIPVVAGLARTVLGGGLL